MREVVKVRAVGNSLVITLPKSLNKWLKWMRGDRVMVKIVSSNEVLISKELFPREREGRKKK